MKRYGRWLEVQDLLLEQTGSDEIARWERKRECEGPRIFQGFCFLQTVVQTYDGKTGIGAIIFVGVGQEFTFGYVIIGMLLEK